MEESAVLSGCAAELVFGFRCANCFRSAAKGGRPPGQGRVCRRRREVLEQMSEITGLKLRTPLKKTLRSRDEIRAYVIREMNDEKNPQERYASARSAEAFGLIPKGFDFDHFMVELLTEQIAGLY